MKSAREKINEQINAKKISLIFSKITANPEEVMEQLDLYFDQFSDAFITEVHRRYFSTLMDFVFEVMIKMEMKLKTGRIDLVLDLLRKDIRKEINNSHAFHLLILIWISLRNAMAVLMPRWVGKTTLKSLLNSGKIFWEYCLMEISGAYSEYADQVIREKTLESSVLFHTTQSITTELNLDALINKIVFHAGMLLQNKQIFLFVPESEAVIPRQEGWLVLKASNLTTEAYGEYRLKMGEGPIGQTALDLVARVENNFDRTKKMPFLGNAAHLLVVPIVFSEQLLGVLLAVETKKKSLFERTDKELMMMYAQQIAVTFKNVMLYQDKSIAAKELEEKNFMLESQADLILRKSAQMTVLNEVTQKVNSSIELNEVLELLTSHAADCIGVDRCIVWLFDEMKVILKAEAASGLKNGKLEDFNLSLDQLRGTVFMRALAELSPQQVTLGGDVGMLGDVFEESVKVKTMLVVPLVFKEEAIGMLAVDDTREVHDFLDDEVTLISSVANQTVMAIENARLYQKVKEQAITDALTGVYNHRFFQIRFSDEYSHSKRYGNDFSLIILDIDHFKFYNDTYGHVAGDLALKEIANLTKSSVRENDMVARYGGEEFAIILPMTNMDGAYIVAERIRNSVLDCRFLGDLNMPLVSITVSLGVSTYCDETASREIMFKQADKALYAAKESGRNKTVRFTKSIETGIL